MMHTGRTSPCSTGSQVLSASLAVVIWPLPQYVQGTEHLPTVASHGGTCFWFCCRRQLCWRYWYFVQKVSKMRGPKTCLDNNFLSELCTYLNGCSWEIVSVMNILSLSTAQQQDSNLYCCMHANTENSLKKIRQVYQDMLLVSFILIT